jgi:hypothetical protein
MGVDYDAFLGIGRRMCSKEKVKQFLLENLAVDESWIEPLFDGETQQGLEVQCLDCYSGEDWFVGFTVESSDVPGVFSDNVIDAAEAWTEMFGMETCCRVVHTVKIW